MSWRLKPRPGAPSREGGPRGRSVTRLLRNRSALAALGVLLVVGAIWGVAMAASAQPRSLDDRVTEVAAQLQCLPCKGESVADSPSPWALQVRGVIREKLQSGDSEQQVIQYFVSRYGETIRQVPPRSGFTLLIWLGPVVMLLAGLFVVASVARQWRALEPLAEAADPELEGVSEEELERYRAMLEADLAPDPSAARGGAADGSAAPTPRGTGETGGSASPSSVVRGREARKVNPQWEVR
jgi:cytochrome c-type biogenesis protein CcmH